MKNRLRPRSVETRRCEKEAQVKILDVVMDQLCTRELNHQGRVHIKKIQTNLRNDIRRLTNEIGNSTSVCSSDSV